MVYERSRPKLLTTFRMYTASEVSEEMAYLPVLSVWTGHRSGFLSSPNG